MGQNTQINEKGDDMRVSQVIPLYSQMPDWWKKEYESAPWPKKGKRYLINRARDIKYFIRRILKRFEPRIKTNG